MQSVGPKTRLLSTRRLCPVRALVLSILSGGVILAGPPKQFFDQYCVSCHNQKLHTAGLALDTLDSDNPTANPEVWERVIAKLRAGSMSPPGMPRAEAAAY